MPTVASPTVDFVATMRSAAAVVVASTDMGQRRRTTRGAVASRVSITDSTPTGLFAGTASSPLRCTPRTTTAHAAPKARSTIVWVLDSRLPRMRRL